MPAPAQPHTEPDRRTTQRLAQALHDGLGQTLTALRLTLDLDAADARTQARSLIDQALRELRHALAELRPPLLEDEGLAAALDNEVARRRALHPGVRLALEVENELLAQRWPEPVEYALFMIAREGLEIALSHARVGAVAVTLYGFPDEIELGVAGDGCGPARPPDLMHERARDIGATLDLTPCAGGGTRLTLRWKAMA